MPRKSSLIAPTMFVVAIAASMGLAVMPAFADVETEQYDVQCLSSFSFGAFALASSGNLVLSPEGDRTGTGGVVPLSLGLPSPATFRIVLPQQRAGESCRLTFPRQITLKNTKLTANALVADGFTLNTSPPQPYRNNCSARIVKVGATLHIPDRQPPGNYTGIVEAILEYE